jgi:hypothetical protein
MPSVDLGRGNLEVVARFFDEWQIDIGGGVIAVIEFAANRCRGVGGFGGGWFQ